jgi:GNAT superfamily N-acetyltransferase
MSFLEKYLPLSMIRDHLEDIPQFSIPPGFSARWFRDGDEGIWRDIQSAAEKYFEIRPDLFAEEFGPDVSVLSERMCFLYDNQQRPIGTTTAWFDNDYNGLPHGRVHWVAIIPEMQGKGLSKPLMTIVCNRLRELGHERAYLTTSTVRFNAIRLYSKFGFVPEIKDDQDRAIWIEFEQKIRDGYRI